MLTISHNKSSIARGCWKKFDWRYNYEYTPIKKSTTLTLGSVVHQAFDMFYNGFKHEEVYKYIVDTFDEEIARIGLEEQEGLVIARYTALGMFANYPFRSLGSFEKIESEKSFSVRVGKLRGVRFEGRIDGIVKRDGCWWVRELKTTGLNTKQFASRISTSAQSTGYIYAMRKLGFDVKGTLYDFIKKPLLRKRVNENQNDFGNRIATDYLHKGDMYYGQFYSWRNEEEMQIWEEDMITLIRDMRRRKAYPRNPDACYNYNSECPYKKICYVKTPDPLMLKLYFKHRGEVIINEHGHAEEITSQNTKSFFRDCSN